MDHIQYCFRIGINLQNNIILRKYTLLIYLDPSFFTLNNRNKRRWMSLFCNLSLTIKLNKALNSALIKNQSALILSVFNIFNPIFRDAFPS